MKQITDWTLEQYVLAELPADHMHAIQQQAANDTALQQRIAQLHDSNRALMRALPAQAFAVSVTQAVASEEANAQRKRQFQHKNVWQQMSEWWQKTMTPKAWTTIATAAFLSVFTVLLLPTLTNTPATQTTFVNEDGVRLKGLTSSFRVYRFEQDEPHQLSIDDALHANDLLQLSYVAAGQSYGYLVSVDGNNVTTVHLANADQAVALQSNGEVRLAEGYRLDDAPRFERFILVTSPKPFTTDVVDHAIQALIDNNSADYGQLIFPAPLPQSFSVTSMTFLKAAKE
jgi:anti-sigma-K factor RskA